MSERNHELVERLAGEFNEVFKDWKAGYWSVAREIVTKREWSTIELAELIQKYLPGWKTEYWAVVEKLECDLADAGFECRQRFSRGGIEFLDEEKVSE